MKTKKTKYIHILILLVGTVFLVSGAFHSNIWFDESYTVGLEYQNMVNLCKAATYDVHPLLYYILLKLFSYVFGNAIITLRLFSVLGAVLLALLGYTHIRKDFGEKTGFWFSFFVITMPSTFKYALQIRMYTWAPLFVTLTAIYAYRMIVNGDKRTKNTILFVTLSIMSAYTHYYGLMAVAIINIILFVYYIIHKMNLKKWFLMAIAQIVLYLPGLYIFYVQTMLDGASWIRITIETFIDTISFHFLGVPQADVVIASPSYIIPLCVGICMYVFTGFLLIKMIKKNKNEAMPAILSLIVYFGVILVFLLVSIYRPIYFVRYSIVSYGLLIFAFAYIIARFNKTNVKILIVVVMLALSVVRSIPIYQDNYDASNTIIDDYLKQNMQEGDIFLFDSAGAFSVTVKYKDVPTYFYNQWNWNIEKAYKAFGSKVTIVRSLDDLRNYSGRIWIINRGNTYNELISWFGTKEISSEKIQLEYYSKENNYEFILLEKK